MAESPEVIAAKLSEAQMRALIEAKLYDDGLYARMYSLPDKFTAAVSVYGRGDKLNRLGLAVRSHLTGGKHV